MPPADADSLRALARRHGIAPAWEDVGGVLHAAPEATLRAVLAAMGVDPARPVAGDRFPIAVLPPAIVVRERAQPVRITVTLPEARTRDTLHCRIVEEGARVHRQPFCPAESAATAEGVVDGTAYRSCELTLAATLPCGYHRVDLQTRFRTLARTRVIVVPDTCYQPEIAAGDGRAWGAAVQLYALASERNWGIGDFTDLRLVMEQWAARGADVVGVNPLHALFLAEPERASPYSASSRLFLNPLYLDVEGIADHAESDAAREQVRAPPFQMRLRALRDGELVDYGAVAAAKREVLETLFAHFAERHLRPGSARGREFRAWTDAQGEPLRRFALFEALHEHLAAGGPRRRRLAALARAVPGPGVARDEALRPRAARADRVLLVPAVAVRAAARRRAVHRDGGGAGDRPVPRPRGVGRGRGRRRLGPAAAVRVGGGRRRAPRRLQSARPELGPRAAAARGARRRRLRALDRGAAPEHARHRGTAHRPRDGAVAAVLDSRRGRAGAGHVRANTRTTRCSASSRWRACATAAW